MIWKEKELKTIEDFMKHGIEACDNKKEAREFIQLYLMENLSARANIGYLIGYYSRENQKKYYDWFDTMHPIFGTEELTAEQLIRLGMAIGEARKNHQQKTSPWFIGLFDNEKEL